MSHYPIKSVKPAESCASGICAIQPNESVVTYEKSGSSEPSKSQQSTDLVRKLKYIKSIIFGLKRKTLHWAKNSRYAYKKVADVKNKH